MGWRRFRFNLRRFAWLSGEERRIIARALYLQPLIALALALLGLKRLRRTLAHLAPPATAPAGDPQQLVFARNAARLVSAAAHAGPYRYTCLQQSLTLWWLLRSQGVDCEVRIGIRRAQGTFEAHAWLEHRGIALTLGSVADPPWAPFPALEGHG
jgi:hypothetical protein